MTTKKSSRISPTSAKFSYPLFSNAKVIGWLTVNYSVTKKTPLIYISNQGENNLVEYSIPKNTIQVRSLKAKNASEAH